MKAEKKVARQKLSVLERGLMGQNVTATARDSGGYTSEFSAPWFIGCYKIQNLPLVMKNY